MGKREPWESNLGVDWSSILTTMKHAYIQEIQKAYMRVVDELLEKGKIDTTTQKGLEADSLKKAEEMYEKLEKYMRDFALYGEAKLNLE